ncbi:hydrogenase nickel incorporation protein HypB [uncultured Slackia sp.]|jgi:hydrogenase nickel incorporation protein HypB|uniref:hydrogenase nickel incorporation protein HypB n=1 Tax=uncultured Slackia sp. TaxID=665903 RepID=UPI0025F1711D|nr:hydrogenase nickel incorporation protein HypB [uncultured Slackia sp.]
MKIDLHQPILDKNDRIASENRDLFKEKRVFVLDLLASPGSGKTSTILATIEALRDEFNIAVIEGDIASNVDAERISAQGIAAVQINTGGACHLESDMIRRAVNALDLDNLDLIIVENVGNLVCPTDFDLGEGAKVMILSVPEGDDKPLKYPGVFQVAEAIILNKVDTMSVFNFNEQAFRDAVTQLNPQAPIFPIAATKGEGVEAWAEWLRAKIRAMQEA